MAVAKADGAAAVENKCYFVCLSVNGCLLRNLD